MKATETYKYTHKCLLCTTQFTSDKSVAIHKKLAARGTAGLHIIIKVGA